MVTFSIYLDMRVFVMNELRRFRSRKGLRPLLIYSTTSNYSVDGRRGPWPDCTNPHTDQGLRCQHMHKHIFRLTRLYLWLKDTLVFISAVTLRKHAYSNILIILPSKNENFQIKNSDIFYISAQNIDCGYPLEPPRRGDSNEYPQSMFLSRNKKNNVYPCKFQFYYTKVGFKDVKLI